MYVVKLWFSMLAVLLIQSCGPSSEGTPSLPSGKSPESHRVETKLSEEIDKYELTCEDGHCDKFVGMLVTQQDKMRWRCSAFFIDDDIMATAAHCLPKQLQKPGRSCEKNVYIFLAGQNTPLECREVLEVDQLSSGEFDYAFIKVDRPQKRPFPVSIQREGRYNKQRIKILKVDPMENDIYRGRLTQTQCQLNNDSMVSLYFNGPRTPQIQYSGCQTVSGNSGAPILNFKNQVIGIHHSSIKPSSELSLAFASQTAKGRVDEFGSATNFGCLCPAGESYRRCLYYRSCRSQNDKEYLLSARQKILDRLLYGNNRLPGLEQLDQTLNFESSRKYFNWTPQLLFKEVQGKKGNMTQLKMYFSYRPSCLKNEWEFNDLPLKNNTLTYEDIPFCEVDYGLSSSLRLQSISSEGSTKCRNLKASFKLEDPNKLVTTSRYAHETRPFSMPRSIPYCD